MKRSLKKLSFLTLSIATLGLTSIAYANEKHEDLPTNNTTIATGGGGFTSFGSFWDIPDFDNHIDKMYYKVFGEGFEFIQKHSRQVNRTVYEDGIRMDILSTVTIRQNLFNDIDGQTNSSYTFIALQDETGNRISEDMILNINTDNLQDHTRPIWAHAQFLDYYEDTQTAIFLVQHTFVNTYEENNNIHEHINLVLDGIVTNIIEVNEVLADINLVELVNLHNPKFTQNEIHGTSRLNFEELEELGLNIKDLEESKSLVKDELKIPINGWESAYISNIALKGNFLHIQTNINVDHNISLWEWRSIDQLININTGDTIRPFYGLWIGNFNEDGNRINDREYQEIIFNIEDINKLSNLYLNLTGYYYENYIDTNLDISFHSPVIKNNILIEEDVKILLSDTEVKISNIQISPLDVKFSIKPDYIFSDIDEAVSLLEDNLNVTLIFEGGTLEEYNYEAWGFNTWGMRWTTNEYEDGIEANLSNIEVNLGGSVIDVDKLTGINFNGVVINFNK